MALPEWPPQARGKLPPEMWFWWNAFKTWVNTQMSTQDDLRIETKAKGVILTNAAGTINKRLRLNNAGDGIIIEDV